MNARLLLGLAAITFAAGLQAAAPTEVGVIVDYTPPSATLYLIRNNTANRVVAEIAMEVSPGDRLDLPGNSTVTIELADNKRIVSSGPGSWTVPAASPMGLIGSLFHRFEFSLDPNDVRTMTAITRSADGCSSNQTIAVPALGPDARLGVGTRSIILTWTGGCAPFDVELRSVKSQVIKRAIQDHQIRLNHLSIYPGPYVISIRGADGSRGSFNVTALRTLPQEPADLKGAKSHLALVAQSLWLADAQDGNWRLESVSQLVPLADRGDRLAQFELQRILWTPVMH